MCSKSKQGILIFLSLCVKCITSFYRLLQTIGAPMALRKFPSGACVLQLNTNRDEEIAKVTSEMVIISLTLSTSRKKVLHFIALSLWASKKHFH